MFHYGFFYLFSWEKNKGILGKGDNLQMWKFFFLFHLCGADKASLCERFPFLLKVDISIFDNYNSNNYHFFKFKAKLEGEITRGKFTYPFWNVHRFSMIIYLTTNGNSPRLDLIVTIYSATHSTGAYTYIVAYFLQSIPSKTFHLFFF